MIRALKRPIKAFRHLVHTFWRVNYLYPRKFPHSDIRAALSRYLEKKIQAGVTIESGAIFSEKLQELGHHVFIGADTIIQHCSRIGNYTSISRDVKVGLLDHPQDHISTSPFFYSCQKGWISQDTFAAVKNPPQVEIGHDVLISANTMILAGCKIGTGAIIGAGAVVVKDIPPYAIAVGVPARVVKYRFEENLIQDLLASRWWEVPAETIKNWKDEFVHPEAIARLASQYHREKASSATVLSRE